MMRNLKLAVIVFALLLVAAACGGNSAEEEILEQILESSNEEIGDIDIDTDGDDINMTVEGEDGETVTISGSGDDDDINMTVEGEDGETVTISGSGGDDDEDFAFTVEGEDGESFSLGGGSIPDDLQLPVPEGGEVTFSLETSDDISVMLSYPGGDFDSVVAFYDAQLNPDSNDVDRSEVSFTTEEGDIDNIYWNASDGTWTVSVNTCPGVDSDILDSACVTIFQSR